MRTIEVKFEIDDEQLRYLKQCFSIMTKIPDCLCDGFQITPATTFDEFLTFVLLEGGHKGIKNFGEEMTPSSLENRNNVSDLETIAQKVLA